MKFDEWIDKYFIPEDFELIYKSKSNGKKFRESELRRRHKKAYKQALLEQKKLK